MARWIGGYGWAVVLGLMVGVGWAAHQGDPDAGQAFGDPDRVMEMPEEWHQRPIRSARGTDGRADLIVNLDQQIYHQLAPGVEAYARQNNLKIALSEGTCGISAGALIRKEADLVGMCCPPGDIDRLPGLRYHTLGLAAIVLITHPSNSIGNLTLEQARDIFRGRVFRWSELRDANGRPGPDQVITTIGRLHCKQRPGHWRLLLDHADLFSPRMQEVGAIPDMLMQVANTPGAVGYETLAHVMRYRGQSAVKRMTLNGLDPADTDALAAGLYPLYRAYYLTTWETPALANPHAAGFVRYLREAFGRQRAQFGIAPTEALRRQGWRFKGDELVGEP